MPASTSSAAGGMTTTQTSARRSQRRCMKTATISAAFAIISARINVQRSTPCTCSRSTRYDRALSTNSRPHTFRYNATGCCCPSIATSSPQVEQGKDEDPDEVDEVPVQSGDLDDAVTLALVGAAGNAPRH